MTRVLPTVTALLLLFLLSACRTTTQPVARTSPTSPTAAQQWSAPVRGSWVAKGVVQAGEVSLAGATVYAGPAPEPAVATAARLLAADLEKISGRPSAVVEAYAGDRPGVSLRTLGAESVPTSDADAQRLAGKWEAYTIRTTADQVILTGSDANGTAFAAYTLAERLGIDPLYLWTGYTPERSPDLRLRKTDFFQDEPLVKYRGFYHDDEDILGRPLEANGYPDGTYGSVPTEWYHRFFETAARLRLNQVAPYTRVRRRLEVNELANDYGLIYTSHHYDILLSNPWGYARHGLGKERGVSGEWDWYNNKEGMLRFWRAGVKENAHLNCIWPVGLRGTSDNSYKFPEGTSMAEKRRVFEEVIKAQVALVKEYVDDPVCHLTLYHESLHIFQSGPIDLPPEVILVWNDNGNGVMRALPEDDHFVKSHGIYYHLAFVSWPLGTTVQNWKVITPDTVIQEWNEIMDSRAQDYLLLNLSELREYVMETRLIADICWNGLAEAANDVLTDRYIDWWSREYFPAAAPVVAAAYRAYHRMVNKPSDTWWAADQVKYALLHLERKKLGLRSELPDGLVDSLRKRNAEYAAVIERLGGAERLLPAEQGQYLFEHLTAPLLVDYRQTAAALALLGDRVDVAGAMASLEDMRRDIKRAERAPFTDWYRNTWIRRKEHATELTRSYRNVAAYQRRRAAAGTFTPVPVDDVIDLPAPGETVTIGTDLTLELPEKAVDTELFRLTLADSLVARGRLNPWQTGFFEIYATPLSRGVNRAAFVGLREIGHEPGRVAHPLRMLYTVTNDGGAYVTQATFIDRATGVAINSMTERFTSPGATAITLRWEASPYVAATRPEMSRSGGKR